VPAHLHQEPNGYAREHQESEGEQGDADCLL
jgi:hypothetical protein